VTDHEEKVSLEDAKEQVRKVCVRLGLLHLAFARTLVDELGEEKGKELILKAIKDYGVRIGERGRKKVIAAGGDVSKTPFPNDLPAYGLQGKTPGEKLTPQGNELRRFSGHGCVMSEVWREYGEGELGRLYCYVDPIKSMAYNPDFVHFHAKLGDLPDGDWICEHVFRPSTEPERKEFDNSDKDLDWVKLEPWYKDTDFPVKKGQHKNK
jgi:hypothetical protein